MLVLQHEIIRYVERLMAGVDLSDETLGLEMIEEGIAAGSFLGLEHTVQHFRKELWFPQLLDRRYWEGWAAAGRDDMLARCRALRDRILRDHAPQPLDADKAKAVDELLKAAKRLEPA